MPYSDDELRARLAAAEKRIAVLEEIIESIACGRPWAITRQGAAGTMSGTLVVVK